MLTCRDQQAAAHKGIRKIECVVLFSILHNNFFKTLLTIFTYSGIFLINSTNSVGWFNPSARCGRVHFEHCLTVNHP